jgi:hypothetical protein
MRPRRSLLQAEWLVSGFYPASRISHLWPGLSPRRNLFQAEWLVLGFYPAYGSSHPWPRPSDGSSGWLFVGEEVSMG